MKIAYICGPSGSGKSTLAEKIAYSEGIPCVRLDLVLRGALLHACPTFAGDRFCAGPDELSKKTWEALFQESKLSSAFEHAFRTALHIKEAEPYPEHWVIEGSQLVWPFWRGPLHTAFLSLFGPGSEWGLYLLKQTPDQLINQIRKRNRPSEQCQDIEEVRRRASHYYGLFEALMDLWDHSDACQGGTELLYGRIMKFLSLQK